MLLDDLGRRREAEIYGRRAAQLDPRSAIVRLNLGGTLENLGRFDEAIAEYGVLRDDDLRKGKYTQARARYARHYPELPEAVPTVNSSNVSAAIDLTLVLKMSGDDVGATGLLALSEAAIQDVPRLRTNGFGIADVYIDAFRGEKRKALLAWQTAVRAGWRGPFWRLARDHDENLSSIRNEPEFKAVFADIERDMARQRVALAARPKDALLELTEATR